MIVKIATVTPSGRLHVSTTTSKDAALNNSGFGIGGAIVRDGVTKNKPVCICNSQCKIQALKQSSLDSMLTEHGSLDQLLQPDNAPKPLKLEKDYRLEKSYHQINGTIYEITRKLPISNEKEVAVARTGQQTTDANSARKKILPKQHSQPQLPIRTSDLIELLNSRPILNVNEKPQPPLRQSSHQKSSASEQNQQTNQRTVKQQHFQQPIQHQQQHTQPNGDISSDHFDRTQRQRHSSRSAGAASSIHNDEFIENRNSVLHQRHSSGPSELALHQTDISEWLLKLPHKRNPAVDTKPQQSVGRGNMKDSSDKKEETLALSKSLKDELTEILKRPIKRQSSGPSELSALKNDIFDWLRAQNIPKKLPFISKEEATCRQTQVFDTPPVPLPRKRHSLGHNGNVKEDPPDWNKCLQYREKPMQSQTSCLDISKDLREQSLERTKPDRQLRHSASEVVSSAADKIATKLDKASSKPKTSIKPQKEKYQYIYKTLTTNGEHPENMLVRKERHRQTQRSATVTDISTVNVKHKQRKSSSAERASRSSSLPRCTDPMCPLLPICTDANCCAYECCNMSTSFERTNAYSEQPMCHEPRCTDLCYKYRCNSLPRCMDSKCLCKPVNYQPNIIKHNSLPRCVYSHRSSSLSRNNSRGSLPRLSSKSKSSKNLSHGKLIKSASAASLSSRRRRNKTVHFGENLLREVCQNRKFIEPLQQKIPSGSTPLNANIQMLCNFVDGVLSSFVYEDDDIVKSGAESEPERGALVRPFHRCNRLRLQTIRRVVNEAAQLRGTLKLGNSRYRHRHWRGTAKECNERFLKKVSSVENLIGDDSFYYY